MYQYDLPVVYLVKRLSKIKLDHAALEEIYIRCEGVYHDGGIAETVDQCDNLTWGR